MRKQRYLWQEISVVLVLKLALIFVLWWLFFSDPIDKKLQPIDIRSHLFNLNHSERSS